MCDACGTDRLLPGIGPEGQRRCTDCAGGLGDFTCTRCGQEGWNHYRGVCGRCVLHDRLSDALDDGTGRVRPELVPLLDHMVAMERPRSGILWVSKPHVGPMLRAVAHGEVPLTHEGVASLSPAKSSIHLRDLLVVAGILPPVDRFLFLFEHWLPSWLEQISDPEDRKILTAYATWRVLRGLRATAATGPVGHYREQIARRQLRAAAAFLTDLRENDLTLAGCTQRHLDRWFAQTREADRANLRPFLRWASNSRRIPALRLPPFKTSIAAPMPAKQRLDLIRRLHDSDEMDLTERVAALLVLLYAQPLSKITRLTVDDITLADGQMLIRLGDPAAPVPPPFDALIAQHLANRPNLMSATNPNSKWLFPGRRAGQPLHPTTIRLRFQQLGIPNLHGRTRALRELLLHAPPAVVAGMLGYTPGPAEAIAAQAGATWKHYAAGDHERTRTPKLGR